MAARKKKAAKKAVKRASKPKKKAAAKRTKRHQPESVRLRAIAAGFTVNDLQRSVDFYTKVLGMVIKDRWVTDGKLMGVELKAGNASIYLGQDDWAKGRDRTKGVGVRLYCTTAQDVDKLAAGIKTRGGALDHDPQTQPWGSRDFGLTDPDGFKITIGSM